MTNIELGEVEIPFEEEEFISAFSDVVESTSTEGSIPPPPLDLPPPPLDLAPSSIDIEGFTAQTRSLKKRLKKLIEVLHRESGMVGGLDMVLQKDYRKYPFEELKQRAKTLQKLASTHRQIERSLKELEPTVSGVETLSELEIAVGALERATATKVKEFYTSGTEEAYEEVAVERKQELSVNAAKACGFGVEIQEALGLAVAEWQGIKITDAPNPFAGKDAFSNYVEEEKEYFEAQQDEQRREWLMTTGAGILERGVLPEESTIDLAGLVERLRKGDFEDLDSDLKLLESECEEICTEFVNARDKFGESLPEFDPSSVTIDEELRAMYGSANRYLHIDGDKMTEASKAGAGQVVFKELKKLAKDDRILNEKFEAIRLKVREELQETLKEDVLSGRIEGKYKCPHCNLLFEPEDEAEIQDCPHEACREEIDVTAVRKTANANALKEIRDQAIRMAQDEWIKTTGVGIFQTVVTKRAQTELDGEGRKILAEIIKTEYANGKTRQLYLDEVCAGNKPLQATLESIRKDALFVESVMRNGVEGIDMEKGSEKIGDVVENFFNAMGLNLKRLESHPPLEQIAKVVQDRVDIELETEVNERSNKEQDLQTAVPDFWADLGRRALENEYGRCFTCAGAAIYKLVMNPAFDGLVIESVGATTYDHHFVLVGRSAGAVGSTDPPTSEDRGVMVIDVWQANQGGAPPACQWKDYTYKNETELKVFCVIKTEGRTQLRERCEGYAMEYGNK